MIILLKNFIKFIRTEINHIYNLTMISIEQESGSSVLIEIHGIPERGSASISPLIGDNDAFANVGGDVDNDGDEMSPDDTHSEEPFRRTEEFFLQHFVELGLIFRTSWLETEAKVNFPGLVIPLSDNRIVLLFNERSKHAGEETLRFK